MCVPMCGDTQPLCLCVFRFSCGWFVLYGSLYYILVKGGENCMIYKIDCFITVFIVTLLMFITIHIQLKIVANWFLLVKKLKAIPTSQAIC